MGITKEKRNLMIAGILVGIIAVVLVAFGNPANMGFCIACFVRDTAGALHLHSAAPVQYLRPEIIGLVLGAFCMAVLKGDFRAKGGSSPMLRFVLGFFMMTGALVFLGCPLRMVLRLAGGDLNALVGLFGFAAGVAIGCVFLKKGFSLGRTTREPLADAVALPIVQVILLIVLLAFPTLLAFSEKGPGSMHAPIFIALLGGLVVGGLAQRTRMCMAGGIRDVILFRDRTLITGPFFIFLAALVGNLITGRFKLGFTGQPIAHSSELWNFLGMTLCGLAGVMLGGCPLRQLILAGEGNSDSAVAVLGMAVGAAFAHNFKVAGSADSVVDGVVKVGGTSTVGKVTVVLGIIILCLIAVSVIKKNKEASV